MNYLLIYRGEDGDYLISTNNNFLTIEKEFNTYTEKGVKKLFILRNYIIKES